jgi:hypothetical protein
MGQSPRYATFYTTKHILANLKEYLIQSLFSAYSEIKAKLNDKKLTGKTSRFLEIKQNASK